MACGPFFYAPVSAGGTGTMVESRLTASPWRRTICSRCKPLQDAIPHAVLGPVIQASVDGVPVAKSLRQSAPLAPLLGHVQQRLEHLQVGKADMASVARKAGLDTKILRLGAFQEPQHTAEF